jgi:hypothetical protein
MYRQQTMNEDDPPRFPDINPSSITKTYRHEIIDGDITEEEELNELIAYMYQFSERKYYLYWQKDQGRSQILNSAIVHGSLIDEITEYDYYKHPKFNQDFVKILRKNIQFVWEEHVINTQPMYARTTLGLSKRTKPDLHTKEVANEISSRSSEDKAESAKPLDTRLRRITNQLKDHPVVFAIGLIASIFGILTFFGFQWPGFSLTSSETDMQGKPPSPSSQQTSEVSLEIFRPGSPYPVGFEVPKLGARLTDVKTFYEGVEVDLFAPMVEYVGLTVTLENNIFGRITYSFSQPEVDPILITITFYPIDDEVMTQVRKEALVAFADDPHETFALGEIIQWRDVGGVKVVVGQKDYIITPVR